METCHDACSVDTLAALDAPSCPSVRKPSPLT
jgi:hypothetical protein